MAETKVKTPITIDVKRWKGLWDKARIVARCLQVLLKHIVSAVDECWDVVLEVANGPIVTATVKKREVVDAVVTDSSAMETAAES